jgi:hypothetical protein
MQCGVDNDDDKRSIMSALATNRVTFGCTALIGSNKVGIIKPDAQGYRTMVVGGLNMYNSGNAMYVNDDYARQILVDASSEFQRMVSRGVLRGEYGHPKREPGMKDEDHMRRALQIFENRVCVHYRKVWLDANLMKDSKGRPIVAVMSELCPSGELGPVLERHLNNPSENACFSIRSFTKDTMGGDGIKRKSLRKVVTFDYVNEPGMENAEKYKAPSLESYSEESFSRTTLERVYTSLGEDTGMSMEDNGIRLSLEDLFGAMGWRGEQHQPRYLSW